MPAVRASSPLPALPIVPIVPEIAPIKAVFHPCVVAQHTTADLVVYTRDLGRIITVAYPLGPLGVRIVPSGVFNWMERRGLVWECFCALVSGQPTPARFVNEFLSNHTVVRCHHVDDQCGFYLDLTKIYTMTMFESSYEGVPTLPFGKPDIQELLSLWHRQVVRDATLLQRPAPYVEGYFGIHTSMYPGVRQLRSGLQQLFAFNTPRRRGSYHPYSNRRTSLSPNTRSALLESTPSRSARRRTSTGDLPTNQRGLAPVAGPSRLMARVPEFSEREVEALTAVRMGFGISRDDADDLLETCDHCRRVFMRSALRMHIKKVNEEDNASNEEH